MLPVAQVTPSALLATISVSVATNTNLPLPYTLSVQAAVNGSAISLQVIPVKLDDTLDSPLAVAINLLLPAAKLVIVPTNGSETSVQVLPLSLHLAFSALVKETNLPPLPSPLLVSVSMLLVLSSLTVPTVIVRSLAGVTPPN